MKALANEEEYLEHLDYLIDLSQKIDTKEITILTGANGSGKSLLRSFMTERFRKDSNKKVKSVSMEFRTSSNNSFGALGGIGQDSSWMATSYNTYNLMTRIIKAAKDSPEGTGYIVLDEIEIGCSEETILCFIDYLNKELKEIKELGIGVLIITHSRIVVEKLNSDSFVDLQELTKEQWLNRKIIPTTIEELENNDFFKAIRGSLSGN